jgi:hypothetical protein
MRKSNGSATLNARLATFQGYRRAPGRPHHRLPMEWTGMAGRIADAFNDVAD